MSKRNFHIRIGILSEYKWERYRENCFERLWERHYRVIRTLGTTTFSGENQLWCWLSIIKEVSDNSQHFLNTCSMMDIALCALDGLCDLMLIVNQQVRYSYDPPPQKKQMRKLKFGDATHLTNAQPGFNPVGSHCLTPQRIKIRLFQLNS